VVKFSGAKPECRHGQVVTIIAYSTTQLNQLHRGRHSMEKMLRSAVIFVIGVAVGSLAIPALSQQVRSLKTTRLMTTDLAGFCDGKEVVVDTVKRNQGRVPSTIILDIPSTT
jgi:hypothetical protein